MQITQATLLWTIVALLATPAFAANGKGEVQLQNASASVKTVSILLRGTETDQQVLNTVKGMVSDILNRAELAVDRVPVKGDPVPAVPVYENLEIVISVTGASGQGQPHRVGITLQEVGSEGEPQFFDYFPNEVQTFVQTLQTFLTSRLNLRLVEQQ
jgi:hypothetical protein